MPTTLVAAPTNASGSFLEHYRLDEERVYSKYSVEYSDPFHEPHAFRNHAPCPRRIIHVQCLVHSHVMLLSEEIRMACLVSVRSKGIRGGCLIWDSAYLIRKARTGRWTAGIVLGCPGGVCGVEVGFHVAHGHYCILFWWTL